jgi:hypothetical protein
MWVRCGKRSNLEAVWDVPDLGDFPREAASAFRLILLDRRGFGLSDWPISTGSQSPELGMDDIRALMDAAGSERGAVRLRGRRRSMHPRRRVLPRARLGSSVEAEEWWQPSSAIGYGAFLRSQ